jgi:hypothetical protein
MQTATPLNIHRAQFWAQGAAAAKARLTTQHIAIQEKKFTHILLYYHICHISQLNKLYPLVVRRF